MIVTDSHACHADRLTDLTLKLTDASGKNTWLIVQINGVIFFTTQRLVVIARLIDQSGSIETKEDAH